MCCVVVCRVACLFLPWCCYVLSCAVSLLSFAVCIVCVSLCVVYVVLLCVLFDALLIVGLECFVRCGYLLFSRVVCCVHCVYVLC